jgi:ABC-2 type transport system permease protein
MSRVLVIATTEFLTLVRSKFFLVGILVVPALMGVLMGFMRYANTRVDRADRPFAVIDRTGVLYDAIEAAAREHNDTAGPDSTAPGPRFLPTRVDPAGRDPLQLEADLSDRVRRRELFAFVEIPAAVLEPGSGQTLRYYSESTSYQRLSTWLASVLDEAIERARLRAAGLDPAVIAGLTAKAPVVSFNLLERRPDGSITAGRRVDEIQSIAVPIFFLVLMFMAIMSNAQHLIHAIIEEKMSKISEVLLGSVSAFQLLMGKLLGIVAVSLALAFVYLAGGAYALVVTGRPDLIDPGLVAWFLLFLICATLMFGALHEALSSACSDLKDAQNMLQPAMMMLVAAYFMSAFVLRAPDSAIATAMSFVPPVTPFAMVLRLAIPPGPPLWQVWLSIVMLVGVTVLVVWAAGRVFRVGLLMQGKPPNLPELLRWIRQ